jgi:hypothetical protein
LLYELFKKVSADFPRSPKHYRALLAFSIVYTFSERKVGMESDSGAEIIIGKYRSRFIVLIILGGGRFLKRHETPLNCGVQVL